MAVFVDLLKELQQCAVELYGQGLVVRWTYDPNVVEGGQWSAAIADLVGRGATGECALRRLVEEFRERVARLRESRAVRDRT